MSMIQNPLVSVIVITYNSESSVLETLDSIKSQTYQNIELIISDDCSKDNTVELCNSWLLQNKERFVRTEMITAKENTGISANCNRGLNLAQGEWVKLIAGDDSLFEDCVLQNIAFIKENPDIRALQSFSEMYVDKLVGQSIGKVPLEKNLKFFELQTPELQNKHLQNHGNVVAAPSMFIEKKVLDKVGGYDERFKMMEDFPLWLKLTETGTKIYFFGESTIRYRIHSKSVMKNKKPFISAKFAYEYISFIDVFFKSKQLTFYFKKEKLKYRTAVLFEKLGLNRPGFIPKVLYAILFRL
ncbi:MAG: glycosyltransferase [Chryseobacterium sp.]|uniref:glycosyltransferase n=1 Tax=Chryseobacterium sp. TaxID=1871047 RepID=UPI0025C3378D|nr:glycosyltransferase [Chryseobacterium sp.]MCJ7933001.1 glycosyltransferase [Chryseobacterium sp.]